MSADRTVSDRTFAQQLEAEGIIRRALAPGYFMGLYSAQRAIADIYEKTGVKLKAEAMPGPDSQSAHSLIPT